MKKLLLLLLFSPAVTYAQSDWESIGFSGRDSEYFIREVSVDDIGGISFWVKNVSNTLDRKTGMKTPGKYSVSKWEGDCKAKTIITKIMVMYNKKGKIRNSTTGPFQEAPVIPDTMGEKALNAACTKIYN